MLDDVIESANLSTSCQNVRILEAQARELSRQGQATAAMHKFVAVAQICGPCLKKLSKPGCL